MSVPGPPHALLTWNIRAGGGTRLARIAEAIAAHEADVLVLTEYRSGEAGNDCARCCEIWGSPGSARSSRRAFATAS